jgi:hypothetical protein
MNIKVKVDVLDGPLPNGGFRRGLWPFSIIIDDGLTPELRTGSIFATVPHECELTEQRRLVELELARNIVGVYVDPTRHRKQVQWDNEPQDR